MKTIKEKPKNSKGKRRKGNSTARSQPAISPKQAAKLMKDKYVQQLDQRQTETGSAEVQAVEQVQGAESWAVDELIIYQSTRSPRQHEQRIKEKHPDSSGPAEQSPTAPAHEIKQKLVHQSSVDSPVQGTTTSRPQRRAVQLKEKPVQPKGTHQLGPSASTVPASPEKNVLIKERSVDKIKAKSEQTAVPVIKEKDVSSSGPSIVSIESIQTPNVNRQSVSPQEGPAAHSSNMRQRLREHTTQAKTKGSSSLTMHTPSSGRSTRIPGTSPVSSSAAQPMPAARQQAMKGLRQGRSVAIQGRKTVSPQADKGGIVSVRGIGQKWQPASSAEKGIAPKVRGAFYRKEPSAPKSSRIFGKKVIPRAGQTAQRTAQRRMTQRAVQQVRNTVRAPAAALKKTAAVVTRAAVGLINSLIALAGGSILLLAMVVVIVVAAIANSPFGLFFAQEPNASGTVSVSQAVGTVNIAYNNRLELLQAGDYDDITVQGQAADWPEILAVFAVKTAGTDVDGLDVATLDADRVNKLTTVFWDMTSITVTEEAIDHPAVGSTEAWSEKILHITITPKTANDMRTAYAFSEYQNSALDELLLDRAALASLAGSLTITSTDVRDVLAALPDDLEQARQDTVQTALQLVGKVNYFWGGKSRVIGWDSRWGQLKKVTAAGNSTSGTYRPFGLDCSGFVDWTFNNSLGYIIGHGGGAHAQHTYCTNISQSAAQPGDLAFYPDDSHVGIIVGRNAAGKLLVCHCSSGSNNVVVTEFSASGFTAVGRPDIFAP